MPRSVAEIQAEIAKVKQEIATRDMYRQPQSRVGWATYVGTGDRGLLDAYQNREDQYNKMIKQQQFQAAEAALNRKFQEAEAEKNRQNAKAIAAMNKNSESRSVKMKEDAKAQLEADIAQAEYDDALSKYDTNDPNTKLALQRAALKLNYANKNLGYYDPTKMPDVNPDYSKDGPIVVKRNKVKKLTGDIKYNLSSKDSKSDPWTNEKRSNVDNWLLELEELNPEVAKELRTEFNKMPATAEDKANADKEIIRKFNDMTSGEQAKYIADHPGTAKRLNLQQRKSK